MQVFPTGKVVILLHGRYAGKKAVIYSNNDAGSKGNFGSCLVVGLDRAPLKVTTSMSAKKIAKRSKVKPFVKLVNQRHVMPTRYAMDVDLKKALPESLEVLKDSKARKAVFKDISKVFEERYNNGQNKWFFQKLRF